MLGDGKVIEIGTPQDLLSASTDSAFRRLVRLGAYRGGEWGERQELEGEDRCMLICVCSSMSVSFVWGFSSCRIRRNHIGS